MRHDRLAAHGNFSDSVGIGIQNAQFDSRQRLADRIGAKRFQIVESQRSARLGEPVAIHHRNSQIIEELHGRGLHESPAGDQRQQLATEAAVHVAAAACG